MSLDSSLFISSILPSIPKDVTSNVQEHTPIDRSESSTEKFLKQLPDYFDAFLPEESDNFSLSTLNSQPTSTDVSYLEKANNPVVWISMLLCTIKDPSLGFILYLVLVVCIIIGCKLLKTGDYFLNFRRKTSLLFWSTLFSSMLCATYQLIPINASDFVPLMSPAYNPSLSLSRNVQALAMNNTGLSSNISSSSPKDTMCMLSPKNWQTFTDISLYSAFFLLEKNMCMLPSNNVTQWHHYNTRKTQRKSNVKKPLSEDTKMMPLKHMKKALVNYGKKENLLGDIKSMALDSTVLNNSSYGRVNNKTDRTSFVQDNVLGVFEKYYEYEFQLRMKRLRLLAEISRLDSKLKSITHFTFPSKKLIDARALDSSITTDTQKDRDFSYESQEDFEKWNK